MRNDRDVRKRGTALDHNEVFGLRFCAAGRQPLLRIDGLPDQRSQPLSGTRASGQYDQQARICFSDDLTLAPLSDAFQFVRIVCGYHHGWPRRLRLPSIGARHQYFRAGETASRTRRK